MVVEENTSLQCNSCEIEYALEDVQDLRCLGCRSPLTPVVADRDKVLKNYQFDRWSSRNFRELLWQCLIFPCQWSCLGILVQLTALWMLCNSLLYLIAYASLVEFVVNPPPMVTLAHYGGLVGVAGPGPAIFVAAMTGPLLALRCFEITSQTSNGIASVGDFAKFDSDGLLQGVLVLGVFCGSAIPGMIVGHKLSGVLSGPGIGGSVTSMILLLPVIAVCFVVDRRVVQFSIVEKWRGWLAFHGLTFASASLYVAAYFAITWPLRWALRDLVDITITSKSGWFPLLLVVGGTLLMWTAILVLFVYLLFVYARLLGHLTQWLVQLESDRSNEAVEAAT